MTLIEILVIHIHNLVLRFADTSIQGGPKNRTILNVDKFAMVSSKKACDMSKVCKFCLEKSVKLA